MSNDIVTRGGVPVNRRQRRAELAMRKAPHTPNYTMRVLLIDGFTRKLTGIVLRAGPDNFAELLGNRPLSWAKLGEIDERVHIMLAGDKSEQEHAPGHRWFEPEFEVLNEAGEASPVLHGKAAVFGYMPALHKGGSTPVGLNWLVEKVRWLEPGAAARAALEGSDVEVPVLEHQARLEDQSGQSGETEEA